MELQDLVGSHVLDAVDFSTEQVKEWDGELEDCNAVRFRLDGKCYVAIEDPDDGYRSSMRELIVIENTEMKNIFTPLKVVGKYRTCGHYGENDDILELVDAVTDKVVLEVGTEDINSYYPAFISSFHPEAMAHNS